MRARDLVPPPVLTPPDWWHPLPRDVFWPQQWRFGEAPHRFVWPPARSTTNAAARRMARWPSATYATSIVLPVVVAATAKLICQRTNTPRPDQLAREGAPAGSPRRLGIDGD